MAVYFQIFISLFSILNPLSAIPLYLNITRGLTHADKKVVAFTCGACVFIILFGALFLGQPFMDVFSIHDYSLRLAGGLIVLLLGVSIVLKPATYKTEDDTNNVKNNHNNREKVKSLGISPLSFPMVVGPAAIVMIMLYGQQEHTIFGKVAITMVLLLLSIAIVATFLLSGIIAKGLGDIGLMVLSKIMGLIIAAVALEMIVAGLKSVVPILVTAARTSAT